MGDDLCTKTLVANTMCASVSVVLFRSHSSPVRSRSTFNIIKLTYSDFIQFFFFVRCLSRCANACLFVCLACMWPVSVYMCIYLIWQKVVVAFQCIYAHGFRCHLHTLLGFGEFDANAF